MVLKLLTGHIMKYHKAFLILFVGISLSCGNQKKIDPSPKEKIDYSTTWEKIESLQMKGMQKSAIQELNALLESTLQNEAYPSLFKALAIRSKYLQEVEENSADQIINSFQEKIDKSTSPGKQLLQSALAELYLQYLQSHLWKIQERTKRSSIENSSISFMSEEEIREKATQLYYQSLEDSETLKKTPLHAFEEIYTIQEPNQSYLNHFSVFDFLSRRALDHFENSAMMYDALDKISSDSSLFLPANRFVKIDWNSKAVGREVTAWLTIASNSLELHMSDQNEVALFHFNQRRLKASLHYSTHPRKEQLYTNALKELLSTLKIPSNRDVVRSLLAANYYQNFIRSSNTASKEVQFAFDICQQCEEDTSYGAIQCKNLIETIQSPSHGIDLEMIYPTAQDILFSYRYANLDSSFFRIIQLSEKEVWNLPSNKEELKRFLKTTPLREWTQNLFPWNDFSAHRSELMTEKLRCGDYLLVASNRKDFHIDSSVLSANYFKVSDIAYLEKTEKDGSKSFRLKDRLTGEPLKKAKITVYSSQYDQMSRSNKWEKVNDILSDKEGRFQLVSGTLHNNVGLKIEHNQQYLIPTTKWNIYRQSRNRGDRKMTTFFTDRSIYRLGQTVYFKGIHYQSKEAQETILSGEATTVKLYDPRGEVIESIQLRSNGFGSFSGSFILPKNLLNGHYRLANEFGSCNFRVEEYKQPSLRIEFDDTNKIVAMGDTICASGKIESYTGLPINQGKLDYKIVRRNLFYPQPMLSSYYPSNRSTIIKSGTMDLSDHYFSICFPTAERTDRTTSFAYDVILNVTSSLGENIAEKYSYYAGQIPFELKADIPENLTTEQLNRSKIVAEDLNGKPVSVKGELSIYSLKTPKNVQLEKFWNQSDHQMIDENTYAKVFPHFSQTDDWQLSQFKKDVRISSISFQSDKEINAFRELKEGAYLMEAISLTERGDSIRLVKPFRLYSPKSNKPPYPEYFWSQIEKSTVKQGKEIKLQLNSSLENLPLLYEVYSKGELIDQNQIKLSNEKRWIPIPTENLIGEVQIQISGIALGRTISEVHTFFILPKQEAFKIYLKTKRDYTQPGQKEKWTIGIENLNQREEIEVMASMYDHSLDQLEKQDWTIPNKFYYHGNKQWEYRTNFGQSWNTWNYTVNQRKEELRYPFNFPYLNWFDFYFGNRFPMIMYADNVMLSASPENKSKSNEIQESENIQRTAYKNEDDSEQRIRDDFRETVFFYPQLQNEGQEEIEFEFTIPDALTEWRFRALAHNQELHFSKIDHLLISRKELMVQSYFPKFCRVNDEVQLKIEVTNASDTIINGKMGMKITDAESGQLLNVLEGEKDELFSLLAGEKHQITYTFRSPNRPMILRYQLFAKGENHSDIEEGFLQVLPSSILISESYPFEVDAGSNKSVVFKSFADGHNHVVSNRSYSVEYATDPRWLAVYALPSMIQEQEENAEMIFSALYAHALSHITMRKVDDKNALQKMYDSKIPKSQLQQNEVAKYLTIEQTPWIGMAREEELQRRKLSQLFDENNRQYEIEERLKKLKDLQLPNGAWPWFKGMRANLYLTQYISGGLGKLNELKTFSSNHSADITKAILKVAYQYLDEEIEQQFKLLQERGIDESQDYVSPSIIQYLYVRSLDKEWKPNAAASFYLQQLNQFWQNKNALLRAKIALTEFHLNPNSQLTNTIVTSLKDIAIRDSLGIHWNFTQTGPYWYQSPIEAQAYIIELYQKTLANDPELAGMKKWLLHQKKQQYWPGNTASAQACYALLSEESSLLVETEEESISVGKRPLKKLATDLPGVVRNTWIGDEIKAELAEIEISQTKTTFGWGAAYWTYFEEMDKVGSHSKNGLHINSIYYLHRINEKGQEELIPLEGREAQVGDLIKQRTEININYDLDFVMISDHPPACLETTEKRSGMQFSDGINYYVNIKNDERQWFIDHLRKGQYVFETDYRVSHSGNFKGGVSTLQCSYAPEFVAHTTAGSLKIKD